MSESDMEFVERIEANAIIAGADLSRLFGLARRGAEMQMAEDDQFARILSARKRDIDRRECTERAALLADHDKKFALEKEALQNDCAAIGHVRGRYWDNGLGWEWYHCAHCDARMEIRQYADPELKTEATNDII